MHIVLISNHCSVLRQLYFISCIQKMMNSSFCSNQGDLVCGLCDCEEGRCIQVQCVVKIDWRLMWREFSLYPTGLVTGVNVTLIALSLHHSCVRMCNCTTAQTCNPSDMTSPQQPTYLYNIMLLCSNGPNGEMCSGPNAGECVCGQCKCRQNVNPQVRLIPQYNYYKQDCTIGLCTTCVQQSVIPLFTSSDDHLRFNKKAFSTGCYLFYWHNSVSCMH